MTEPIKLPPLPSPFGIVDPSEACGCGIYGLKDLHDYAQAYALAAIEPYAKRIAKLETALQSQKPEPNNLMLSAVIRMPFEMAMADPISRMQFYQRAQQALNELEALQSQDREDAERLDWLEDRAQTSRTGVSIDYVYDPQDGYVNEKGYRFMRHRFIGPLGKTAREAIDHARRVDGGVNE